MFRIIILSIALIFALNLSAQFGLRLSAAHNNYKSWDEVTLASIGQKDANLFKISYEVGLDYWLRLKEKRIEFYPEVSYRFSSSDGLQTVGDGLPRSYKLSSVAAGLNIHLYPFDLLNDCDCPTFSKQSGLFRKGFFIMIGAKEYYQRKSIPFEPNHTDFALAINGGVGFDIGINDLLTVSPFINAKYFPSTEWEGFNTYHGITLSPPLDETTSNLGFEIGIRLGFRPDYLKNK